MKIQKLVSESDLAALAKKYRMEAGKKRAQAAREFGVSHVSIIRAEDDPSESLAKLRIRMIESYSPYAVSGPVYRLDRKKR